MSHVKQIFVGYQDYEDKLQPVGFLELSQLVSVHKSN